MADRPSGPELIEAVRRCIDEELLPELEGVRRFHARVASNALGIAAREFELQGAHDEARRGRLARLLGGEGPVDELEAELVRRIRAGEADAAAWREEVLTHLRETVRERLAVANPDYR